MRTIRLLIVTFAALLLVGGVGAGVASAQGTDYPIPVPDDGGVLPDTLTPPAETPPGEVTPLAQQAPVRASTGGLPVTGGDLVGLTVVGLGAIGLGVVLVRSRRAAA